MGESGFVICVVDDDPSVRASLTRLLGEHGYVVETFESGAAFLQRDAGTVPCQLLLDVSMPEMDGIELVQQLRRAGRQHCVVFMSAHDDEITRRRIAQIGRIELLRKPFAVDQVIAALARATPLA